MTHLRTPPARAAAAVFIGLSLLCGSAGSARAAPSAVTEIVPPTIFVASPDGTSSPAVVGIGVTMLRHTYKWGAIATPPPLKHLAP